MYVLELFLNLNEVDTLNIERYLLMKHVDFLQYEKKSFLGIKLISLNYEYENIILTDI